MLHPPALKALRRYPVTGGVMIAAVGASVAWWWLGAHARALITRTLPMTHEWWPHQPWRLLTSALPHGDILHLAFNLYWLWVFGTFIEERFGPLKTGGMLVLFAAGSAAAEFAFLRGGVGLSGVGYGLFGFLWVASRESRRFANAIDERTMQIFVGWFVLCIVLTLLKVLNVGNIAHGVGAVLGIVLGLVYVNSGVRRQAMVALLVAMLLACGIVASVARPYVNLSPRAAVGKPPRRPRSAARFRRDGEGREGPAAGVTAAGWGEVGRYGQGLRAGAHCAL